MSEQESHLNQEEVKQVTEQKEWRRAGGEGDFFAASALPGKVRNK